MSDLKFDLSRSLKVKSNGALGLHTYEFLLASNSNHVYLSSISCYSHLKKLFLLFFLNIRPKFWTSLIYPYSAAILFKMNGFLPGSEGKPPPNMKLVNSILFTIFLHTDKQM